MRDGEGDRERERERESIIHGYPTLPRYTPNFQGLQRLTSAEERRKCVKSVQWKLRLREHHKILSNYPNFLFVFFFPLMAENTYS